MHKHAAIMSGSTVSSKALAKKNISVTASYSSDEEPIQFQKKRKVCHQKEFYLGTSGYCYDHWKKGVFYPRGVDLFKFYSAEFDSVELNSTFYRIPKLSTWKKWCHDSSPRPSFTYVVKANQYFTHWRQLNVDDNFAERWHYFYEQGCKQLGDHLGPILFQLPPKLTYSVDKLYALRAILPRDGRYVFEFRHASWYCQEIYDAMRSCNFCFAAIHIKNVKMWVGDLKDGWNPTLEGYQPCCDWGYYLRLHGSNGQYVGSYGEQCMEKLAKQVVEWKRSGKNVYVMYNNTDDGRPPSAIVDLRLLQRSISRCDV
uniref:DUF72 domain-containing protein n=1 Tax=Spongospora subterranea TaxID=70186 RepID=A0A0H5R634_9EUKA|eukprot:CRZ03684.1 hypothetical protein [Spongospora subterranea]